MTPAETLALTRFVRASCPQQKFDEYTPDAWHELLDDLAFDDAREATKNLARRQPFVSPAEIRTEVRRLRAERHARAGNAEPDYDPDDVTGGLEAIRRARRAVGDGARPLPPARPVAALAASTLAGMDARMTQPSPGYLAAKRRLAASLTAKARDESGVAS